jgi:iron complex outermembrane receptor protein
MRPNHHPLRPLAAAIACLLGSAAHAQTAPAAPAPAASAPAQEKSEARKGEKVQGLPTVVITAERRPSSVQKTAISMTAVSGEEMRTKGQSNVQDVLSDTPAVQVQGSPQGGQVFIRGVGANGDSNWVDPAVSINLDGVYSGRAERVFSSMYDVARVEVLRGPQGTLYGRNSTGGAVNVITNNPSDHFEAGLDGQFGNYNLRHADGYLNVPIGDMLSMRVALMREKRDGYFSNDGRASDLTSGRLKVLFKPTSTFSLLGTADSFESKGTGATTVPRYFSTAGLPPFFSWPTDYSDPWQVDPAHPADTQRTRFKTYSLQADWDLGFGVLTLLPASTSSYRYTETSLITGIAVPGSALPLPATSWEETQRTFEVRLASPAASPLKWVVGAYTYKSDNVQTGTPPSFPPPTFEAYGTRVPADSKAVFGQITYPLSNTLRLTGGLRYTQDKKTYHYGVRSVSPPSTVVGFDSGMLSVENSYSALTYKAGVEADLSAQSLLYAQVASGYKAGGFSTTATPPLAYEPEKLIALEVGSKNRFLDNRLQVNGELYYYRYKNYQVQYADFAAPSPVPGDTATAFQQFVVNAGAGKNFGFELESRYRVLPDTELRAALTYANARYGDFSNPALSYLNGTKVASTAPWTATLGASQAWGLGGGTLTLGGQIKFSDGYRVSIENGLPGGDFNAMQSSFHKTDLRLAYAPDSDKWSLSVWARNLENKAQATQVLPFGRVQITDPRTVGVNVGFKFQ